jgi:hypothetical protein
MDVELIFIVICLAPVAIFIGASLIVSAIRKNVKGESVKPRTSRYK